jgi:hypothetical protein
MKKFGKIALGVVIIGLAIFIWWRFFFVFSEGVKAGDLNYFEKKGFVFKTYEGRLVQEGFQSPTAGALQSNEFRFSAKSEEIAKKLEMASGKFVQLRYKEYFAPVMWRGASKYVVIEVLTIEEGKRGEDNGEMPIE